MVSMNQLDLEMEYGKLNREIFSGSLPEKISVKWSSARRYAGITQVRFNRLTGKCEECAIRISRFLEYSDDEYRETLIHEMIHVKIALMGRKAWKQAPHGLLFRNEMERINRDFRQYSITISDKQFRKIRENHRKMQHGIVVKTPEGASWINLFYRNIDIHLFNRTICHLSAWSEFKNASIYSFNGIYEHTGQFSVRRTERTLVTGLQRPRDMSWFEDFLAETELDREFSVPR